MVWSHRLPNTSESCQPSTGQHLSTPKKLKPMINKIQPEISTICITPLQVQ